MRNIASKIYIYGILTPALVLESLGLPFSRGIAFIILSLGSILFFIGDIWNKDRINFDKIYLVIILFLALTFLAVLTSENFDKSLVVFIQYLSLLFVFYFVKNNSERLKTFIPGLLIALGIVFCIYSLILNTGLVNFLIPGDGYQLVFSKFGSHNHLGDFLVLPMLVCLYAVTKENKRLYTLPFLFFFPCFLLSYSRSAYMSFLLVGSVFLANILWKSKYKKKLLVPVVLFSFVVSIVLLFFFATVFESRYSPFLNPVHKILAVKFGLKFKHFGANRPEYWKTAIKSINEKPYFGVGPGNFVYASAKYSSIPNYRTHSSHNIFLDVLVEYGLFAFICFTGIIILIIMYAFKSHPLYFLLFIALLINFQTDYTFRIFSIALLGSIFVGIIIGQNKRRRGSLF